MLRRSKCHELMDLRARRRIRTVVTSSHVGASPVTRTTSSHGPVAICRAQAVPARTARTSIEAPEFVLQVLRSSGINKPLEHDLLLGRQALSH